MTMLAEEPRLDAVALETRAATISDISFPQRLIRLIVMPYETPTTVYERGRTIEEVVSRGAFGNIQGRRDVKVNRGHVIERVVGKAVRFQPEHDDGLLAELRMGTTADAQDALLLANDGLLGASAGFMLKTVPSTRRAEPDAEVWETKQRRRLNKIWLHHIALTADPAYEAARILDVRAIRAAEALEPVEPPAALVATPLLDQVRRWRFEDRFGSV